MEMECELAVLKTKDGMFDEDKASRTRSIKELVLQDEGEKPGKPVKNGQRAKAE